MNLYVLDDKGEPRREPDLMKWAVFGGPCDDMQDRCSGSRADAEAMHARMCDKVRQSLPPDVGSN